MSIIGNVSKFTAFIIGARFVAEVFLPIPDRPQRMTINIIEIFLDHRLWLLKFGAAKANVYSDIESDELQVCILLSADLLLLLDSERNWNLCYCT
ncbi:MAG TPA: hypothetical protein VFI73_12310 [Candidatus Nitrosopolaris sp.]|nr:hypothetical protein [Candidatus Nitrosopolaris sp.]